MERKTADELKKLIGKKIEILYGGYSYQGVLTLVMEKTFMLSVTYHQLWGTGQKEEEFFIYGIDRVKLVDP